MNNLTKIAALPGSGAGCMASLPAEKNEHAEPIRWPDVPCQYNAVTRSFGKTVQMKSPYFEEPDNIWSAIDWTNFDLSGGFGC